MNFGTFVGVPGADAFSSTRDITVDFGSASNRAVIVRVFSSGSVAESITSVVIDPAGAAISLTAGTEYTGAMGSGGARLRDFWGVGLSVTGSKTVRVTCAGANGKPRMWAQPMDGVTAISSAVDAAATSTTPTVTISSATGRTVVALVSANAHPDTSTMSAASPASVVKRVLVADDQALQGAVWQEAGTASVTIDGSWASPQPTWAMSAWSLTNAGDTTPPILTGPAGTQTGSTTASGSVTTDEANGTLYRLASTNATETAAVVKAAALTTTVTATGAQAVTFTGLTASTTYYAHYVHTDAAGNDSTRVSSAAFTTASGGGDTTPPTMTGTVVVTPSSSAATAVCPTAADNVAVTAYDASINGGSTWPYTSATPTISLTGLEASTAYTGQFRARDAAGNVSTPVLSQAFTTTAAAPAPAATGGPVPIMLVVMLADGKVGVLRP